MIGISTVFVDQPAGIQAGPYVTKITLGVVDDDGTEFPRPVLSISMPTVNMMLMVRELRELFEDPAFLEASKKAMDDDARRFFSPTAAIVSDDQRRRIQSKPTKS